MSMWLRSPRDLVKIKLLTELDSSKNKVGDSVRYRVMDDVLSKTGWSSQLAPKVLKSREVSTASVWARMGDWLWTSAHWPPLMGALWLWWWREGH